METPNLRVARKADLEALVALNREVQAVHLAARPDYFHPTDDREVARWLGNMLEDPSIVVWIAELDGRAVGYLLAMIDDRSENPFCNARVTLRLDQIAVDASMRRRGVARALIACAADFADDQRIEHIELDVWAFNATARGAFERLGFVPRTLTLERRGPRSDAPKSGS